MLTVLFIFLRAGTTWTSAESFPRERPSLNASR